MDKRPNNALVRHKLRCASFAPKILVVKTLKIFAMREIILKWILEYLTKRRCSKGAIPRSGEEGEKVNCYSTFLFENGQPFLIVEEIRDNKIIGLRWKNDRFSISQELPFTEFKKYQLRITHFYGLYTTKYSGLTDFILFGITKFEVLKCNIHKAFNKTSQFVFNKRKLATIDRIELLRTMIDFYFKNEEQTFSTIDLMTKIYSMKWILHPEANNQEHKLQLFLDSFIETGEIERVSETRYKVTGKAIASLSKYEEQERRHAENTKLQRRIVYLTFAIVIVGIFQTFIDYIKR